MGRHLPGYESAFASDVGRGGALRWWSEGEEFVFSHRDGSLQARVARAPEHRPPAVFRPDGEDRYRGVSGRERGELLTVLRDANGRVRELRWAGYPFTRTPEVFGESDPRG